jgi:hypothetical protein
MPDVARLDELFAARCRLMKDAAAAETTSRRLSELRAWQAARLARTYDDLRRDPRCTAAVEFFLSDLYGPQGFAQRDEDFSRAWSRLKRGLPAVALDIMAHALELQILSEELDLAMVIQLAGEPLTELAYANAYRAVGRAEARRRQIDLVLDIGTGLGRIVKFPLIGLALRAAHLPAHLAGFSALHDFLERGFAAFRSMGDTRILLEAIRTRETALMHALFDERSSAG